MLRRIDFVLWRTLEIVVFLIFFPILLVGAWGVDFSDWCGDQAKSPDEE